jgi:hypothetical protein
MQNARRIFGELCGERACCRDPMQSSVLSITCLAMDPLNSLMLSFFFWLENMPDRPVGRSTLLVFLPAWRCLQLLLLRCCGVKKGGILHFF